MIQGNAACGDETSSGCGQTSAAGTQDGCGVVSEVPMSTEPSQSSVEMNGRQTKPKKLSKKQLLAEQRRKDRVCTRSCHFARSRR